MRLAVLAFTALFSLFSVADDATKDATQGDTAVKTPYATFKTSEGDFVIQLNAEKAPISVENFLSYAKEGYYNDTIFHRVIKDFMVQGGGFTTKIVKKATKNAIKNEADNGLLNNRGTVAMARTMDVNSATSQFFVNVKNNYFLNNGYRDFGYAVFGEVIKGMDVIDAMANAKTTVQNGMRDVPAKPIIVKEVIISYDAPK